MKRLEVEKIKATESKTRTGIFSFFKKKTPKVAEQSIPKNTNPMAKAIIATQMLTLTPPIPKQQNLL